MSDSSSKVKAESFISSFPQGHLNALAQLLAQPEQCASHRFGGHLHLRRDLNRRHTEIVVQFDKSAALFRKLIQALLQCCLLLWPIPFDLAPFREGADVL